MSETLNRTFRYKVAEFESDGKVKLEDLLKQAIKAHARPGDRDEITGAGTAEKRHRFINSISEQHGLLTGVLMSYTEGFFQQALQLDPNADSFSVVPMSPNTDEDAAEAIHKEYLEGQLFFGVQGAKVIILGSSSLQSRQLEAHFNWLLSTHTSVVATQNTLRLRDPVSSKVREASLKGVKAITLESELSFQQSTEDAQNNTSGDAPDTEQLTFKPKGHSWDTVVAIMKAFGQSEIENINWPGAIPPDRFRVSVEVKAMYRRRNSSGRVTPILDTMANSLRHIDDEESPYSIELVGGGTITSKDFKISQPFSIKSKDGILDTDDVFDQMRKWLGELANNMRLGE